VRHAPQGTAVPEPAKTLASPPEDRLLSSMKATQGRRQATLAQLKQVSTEWAEVQQANAAAARPQRPPTLAQLFKEEDARDATAQATKTVRFATEAEVRTFGSDGSLLSQGKTVDLDPATGRPMGKDPVRAREPRTEPARRAARPAQSEPGPSTAPAATAPEPSVWQPLSADERRCVAQALPGGGRALRRLNDRAARAARAARAERATSTGLRAGVTRLISPGAPRPLDGQRREAFRELLSDDVHTLADHAKLEAPLAASLLLRAVESGAVGGGLLLDDQLLLMGILGRWAPKEPTADIGWVPLNDAEDAKNAPMRAWWGKLPEAHKKAIEQVFADEKDRQGIALMDGADNGTAESMQDLHEHLSNHYRVENDNRLHPIKPTDTGIARNHLGLMASEASPPVAGEASAEEASTENLSDVAALQAKLDKIHAANNRAIRNHRLLHGDPQPPAKAPRLAEQQRAGPSSG
jgi:hypothetical protein